MTSNSSSDPLSQSTAGGQGKSIGGFGQSSGSLFSQSATDESIGGSLFGQSSGNLFSQSACGSLFGQSNGSSDPLSQNIVRGQDESTGGSLFGQSRGNLFSHSTTEESTGGSQFGQSSRTEGEEEEGLGDEEGEEEEEADEDEEGDARVCRRRSLLAPFVARLRAVLLEMELSSRVGPACSNARRADLSRRHLPFRARIRCLTMSGNPLQLSF